MVDYVRAIQYANGKTRTIRRLAKVVKDGSYPRIEVYEDVSPKVRKMADNYSDNLINRALCWLGWFNSNLKFQKNLTEGINNWLKNPPPL